MANKTYNNRAIVQSAGSITGSFGGFQVGTAPAAFTALIDGSGNNLGSITFPAGTYVPLLVTSASFSGGPVIFFP